MLLSDLKKQQLEKECKFSATRSSGPGGQNVNKVNTRVELRFSLPKSTYITEKDKIIIQNKIENRINNEGELVLVSESERSQLANRQKVTELFYKLIEKALTPSKIRRKTKPSRASRLKRLEYKKQQSEKKQRRRQTGL